MTATIIRGDARALPLPDASVDLIVTSPPYWGLRDYRDGDASLAGQIGAEPTPHEYLDALWECSREWMRVLKPTGSLWINLGDAYYSGKGAPGRTTVDPKSEARTARRAGGNPLDGPSFGVGRKSLIGLPWRYAIGCIDQLGLILRAEVIWDKPNAMPESVTDRVRRSHEHWFHFTSMPRYYTAIDEIREAYSDKTVRTYPTAYGAPGAGRHGRDSKTLRLANNPLGALPGSVWEIATQPLKVPPELNVDHFAAFPMEFPRRIIRGWSPPGICTACGEGRRPVTVRQAEQSHSSVQGARDRIAATGGVISGGTARSTLRGITTRVISDYACACPEPTAPSKPAVVVDPFGGTGTTALIADLLGRRGVSVDRSAGYCRIAAWRTTDPGERARGLEVPKPPPVADDQESLFEVKP